MQETSYPSTPLTEFTFPSRIPVIGPLVSAFRRGLHSISGRWALRWLAQQQDQINKGVAEKLGGQAIVLRSQSDALARLSQQLSEQSEALDRLAGATSRVDALESELASLSGAVAELGRRQERLAFAAEQATAQGGQTAGRIEELARESSEQLAALGVRTQELSFASQTYFEEMGRELGDLAFIVGRSAGEGGTASSPVVVKTLPDVADFKLE